MAQKRLTVQEKCNIMLQFFRTKRDFFQLKEIEKASVKKGIVLQSVKEVLQSLIDDNLVVQEKLGISNYYWSFAKDEGTEAMDKIEKTKVEINRLEGLLKSSKQELEESREGRGPSSERDELVKELNDINEILKKQEHDMTKYAECDPRVFEQRKKEIITLMSDINNITEDIFMVQSYVCDKFGMDRGDFNKNFGVDDEMDLIELCE